MSKRRVRAKYEDGLPAWVLAITENGEHRDDDLLYVIVHALFAAQAAARAVRDLQSRLPKCLKELQAADKLLDAIRKGNVPKGAIARQARAVERKFVKVRDDASGATYGKECACSKNRSRVPRSNGNET